MGNYYPYSRDDFMLDNVSARSVGLVAEIPPVPPLAEQQYIEYNNGSDTIEYIPDTVFEPITIEVKARAFKRPHDFSSTKIYEFLQGKKNLKLTRFSGYHMKIRRLLGVSPIQTTKGNEIIYNISFVCDPWKYIDDNDEFVLPNDGVFVNPGTRYSKPIIRCTISSAPATITTNGETLTINQAGQITIDSERMLVYKTVGNVNTAVTQYTIGKLPMFSVGQNLVAVSSSVSNVTVVGNWRCY